MHAGIQCSPWSAHIFDGTADPARLPGLCPAYCSSFYDACKDTLPYPIVRGGAKLLAEQDKPDFCSRYVNDDAGYVWAAEDMSKALTWRFGGYRKRAGAKRRRAEQRRAKRRKRGHAAYCVCWRSGQVFRYFELCGTLP